MPADGERFRPGPLPHRNAEGDLMLFDNGTSRETTRTLTFNLDEKNKTSELKHHITLPEEFYTARMGSACLVGPGCSAALQFQNQQHRAHQPERAFFVGTQKQRSCTYRAEFVPQELVAPYLVN